MKIVEQSYEVLYLPENPLELVEIAGRTCYQSEDKIGCTELSEEDQGNCPDRIFSDIDGACHNTHCSSHSSHIFALNLRNRGHHAMIEFGDIYVRFITNRGVLQELARHRLCSLGVESTRYVNYKGGAEFIRPVWWYESDNIQQDIWLQAMTAIENYYVKLLNSGWRPEKAREVLPNALKTEIVIKANYREFRHIFQLRCSKKAHPQFQKLVLPLLEEMKATIPVLFDDIYPPSQDE